MGRIKILHIAQCAGGVDCYLRMLFSNMDGESFANVLVCSQDYNWADCKTVSAFWGIIPNLDVERMVAV